MTLITHIIDALTAAGYDARRATDEIEKDYPLCVVSITNQSREIEGLDVTRADLRIDWVDDRDTDAPAKIKQIIDGLQLDALDGVYRAAYQSTTTQVDDTVLITTIEYNTGAPSSLTNAF